MRVYTAMLLAVIFAFGSMPQPTALAAAEIVAVDDDESLRLALRQAKPGTEIRIAPGRYRPGVYVGGLRGTAGRPIVIAGADTDDPPIFEGGSQGWHLSDCAYLTLRNLCVIGQSSNGINADDGGSYDTPAHHLTFENLHISDVGPEGNHDPLKLSGVDDFVVRDCTFEGWGGQAPDMVGCHRGLIEGCTFRGKKGCTQHSGPQTKGGSNQITVRRCLFVDAAMRGVNIGGSTGLPYFRPKGTLYEAKDIVVEGCTFVGCEAPVAFVGVDGAVVRYNTFYRPAKWVLRILQETTKDGFAPCRNGRFERNLIVFRAADVQVAANVGPNTSPETFSFRENWWYCEDRPAASRMRLPTVEVGGIYGIDPQLPAFEAASLKAGDLRPRHVNAVAYGAGAFRAK